MSWAALLTLGLGAYALKLAGVMGLGRFVSGERSVGLARLLPPALLMALVTIGTVSTDGDLVLDARIAGVTVGGLAALKGAPFWLVVVLAAAVTALIRLLG